MEEKEKKEEGLPNLDRTQEEIDAAIRIADSEVERNKAEAAKYAAEAKESEARARKELAEAEQEEFLVYKAELEKVEIDEKRRRKLALDTYHHKYMFSGPVNEASVKCCIGELNFWHRTYPGCDIEIIFNSPGGNVIDGMSLFDYILMLRRDGHKVTTTAVGYAASMAGILLQAGDVRQMGREAYLLVHEISFGAIGSMGEVEDTVEFAKIMQKRVLKIFADRSKMTEDEIDAKWKRKDWWMSSEVALDLGFVDRVM